METMQHFLEKVYRTRETSFSPSRKSKSADRLVQQHDPSNSIRREREREGERKEKFAIEIFSRLAIPFYSTPSDCIFLSTFWESRLGFADRRENQDGKRSATLHRLIRISISWKTRACRGASSTITVQQAFSS